MSQKVTLMPIKKPVDTKNVMCDIEVEFKNQDKMNKKIITLLALAACSNVNANTTTSGCSPEEPWAAQNNVMLVGASVGVASMKDPISTSTEWDSTGDMTVTNTAGEANANALTLLAPVGYLSNIDKLVPSAAKMGFAGRLDVQYGMRQGMFGMFLYAGIGLNQAKTSAQADSTNDNSLNDSYAIGQNALNAGATNTVASSGLVPTANPYDAGPDADPIVTITSGLNFQAGTRMGVWVNNMFFHGIVGWQCLNLQSKVSNVYESFSRTGTTDTPENGAYQLQSDPETLGQLTSVTKKKWTNALVLGAGLDIAHQKWTYGFYYQAAICQRTNFKYNNNFVVGATANAASGDSTTSMALTQTYDVSPVTVSIQPVISTFMMTVKYAFHKA